VRRALPARARNALGRAPDLSRIQERLAYTFRDTQNLVRALTHSSHAHEEGGGPDNEVLEFLGDAALGFIVAHTLQQRFPKMDEGGLSKFKAFLVSRPNLAATARRIDLGAFLRLGKTAEKGHGRTKESLLADALEAVIAAVLLDGGEGAVRGLVMRLFGAQIEGLSREEVERQDFKTVLQEWMQARGKPTPHYRVVATEGPAHGPTFRVSLSDEGVELARGRGHTKKEAEQRAARMALRLLRRRSKVG
jgi:ribonuclease III